MYKKFQFNSNINLYDKIFGFLVKKGKKNKSLNLLNIAFLKICTVVKRPINYILTKLFIILNVFVEIKTVRTRKRVNLVPFPLNVKRRMYLVVKWIFFVVQKNKNKIPFFEKFIKEIFLIIKRKKSEVLKIQSSNISKSLLNRSNIHFRW